MDGDLPEGFEVEQMGDEMPPGFFIEKMGDPNKPDSEKSPREQWMETLNGWGRAIGDALGPAPVRGIGNALLAAPSLIASGVGAAGYALGKGDAVDKSIVGPDKLPYTVDKLIPGALEKFAPGLTRAMQGPPDNMTGAQNITNRAGEFATMAALTPGGAGQNILKDMATAAGYGAAGGASSAATQELGGGPTAQLLAGLLGPIIGHGGVRTLDAAGSKIADVKMKLGHDTLAGVENLTFQALNELLIGKTPVEREQIISALKNAKPGQTVAQALASQSNPTGVKLIQLEKNVRGEGLLGRYQDQESEIADALALQAGGRNYVERNAQVEAKKGVRDAGYTALQNPVIQRVNETANQAGALNKQIGLLGDQSATLAGQMPGLKQTEINALQQQGQLQTAAAQSTGNLSPRPQMSPVQADLLNRTGLLDRSLPGTPPPGQSPVQTATPKPAGLLQMPLNPRTGPANPEAAQIEALAARMRAGERRSAAPGNRQAANDADVAAREFAESRAEAIAKQTENVDERFVIDSEISQIAAAAAELKPLRVDDLTSRIGGLKKTAVNRSDTETKSVLSLIEKEIAEGINPDGTIDAVTLMDIRGRASQKIGTLMKDNPKMSDAKATAAIDTAKGIIDRAITEAGGGPSWGMALKTYGRLSDAVIGKRIQNGLSEAFNPESGGSAAKFINATGDGPAARAFLKKMGVSDPKKKTYADYLLKEDADEIAAIRDRLKVDKRVKKITGDAGPMRPTTGDLTKAEQYPFALRSPAIGVLNYVLRNTSNAAHSSMIQNMDRVMQNPQQVAAGLLKFQPQPGRQMPSSPVRIPGQAPMNVQPFVPPALFQYLDQLRQQTGQ